MSHRQSATDQLVILARFPQEVSAAPLLAELKANGIQASLTGGFTAGFIAEAPGDVQVRVLQSELPAAKKILATVQQQDFPIDWSKIDVGTPEE